MFFHHINILRKVKLGILLGILHFSYNLHAQDHKVSGIITERTGQTMIGASVYWQNHAEINTAADFYGAYQLPIPEGGDSLIISYVGYQDHKYFIPSGKDLELNIVMSEGILMKAFEIKETGSLVEEFSTMTVKKLDIYFNPVSSGDPLKAISLLPSSTNSDETANPELRGASSDLSVIQINGVPIPNPVKASALNGVGYFSLINPELVETMTVYPSNPPLYVGHSVGGLVDISTPKTIDMETTDISLSAASAGLLLSRKAQGGKGYVQIYGNRQFSSLFKAMNNERFDYLKSFENTDLGLNISLDLGNKLRLKYTAYGILEENEVEAGVFNFYGLAQGRQLRNFHILNLSKINDRKVYNLSAGFDWKHSKNRFGVMALDQKSQTAFVGADFTNYFRENWSNKMGISLRGEQFSAQDIIPPYYSSFGNDSLFNEASGKDQLLIPELYQFLKYEKGKWVISGGARLGIGLQKDRNKTYLSGQTNINYKFNKKARILFGIGNYNKALAPRLADQGVNYLNVKQMSLEYNYQTDRLQILSALFLKREQYDQSLWSLINSSVLNVKEKKVQGAELFLRYTPNDNWLFSISNNYLRTEAKNGTTLNPSFNYMLKSNLQYMGKIGTLGLAYINRPGRFYTATPGGFFSEDLGDYIPDYTEGYKENGEQFNTYSNLSFNYSRYIYFEKGFSLIAFLSVSNLFNETNQRNIYFNGDYSHSFYEYYQPRTIYAGLVLKL